MDKGALEALASLALPGGAGAYGWRWPQGGEGEPHPKRGLMPSYARWLYPGGCSKVLVLEDSTRGPYVFGGAALTERSLLELERWPRRRFENGLFDQAIKTFAAAGHVYLDPSDGGWDPGDNLRGIRVTVTRDGQDYAAMDWGTQESVPEGVSRFAEVDRSQAPHGTNIALWNAARTLPVARDGRAWPDGNVAHTRVDWDTGERVDFSWRAAGRQRSGWAPLHDCLLIVSEAGELHPTLREFAAAYAATAAGASLAGYYTDNDRHTSDVRLEGWRNAFGFSDDATLALPHFDLSRVAPAIAGVHNPRNRDRVLSDAEGADNLRNLVRSYVAKLHVAHAFSAVEQGVWPDHLDLTLWDHAQHVAGLSDGLQNLC